MGKPTGFLEIPRQDRPYQKVAERVQSWREFVKPLPETALREQGARCMDCGVPFCHGGNTVGGDNAQGCPVNNLIPDWNNMVYRGRWREALDLLHSTNNFPEFTGRICPAPCEAACTLNVNNDPVGIKSIEQFIIEKGWGTGWVKPQPAAHQTGKKIAVVGSGPAGLAAAQQLARVGHEVTVFEKNDRIGGLLRYGIPDFKMEKHLIDRRIAQMEAEGVCFHYGVNVGITQDARQLAASFDAILVAGGSEQARDLPVPGRDLGGVHFAMEFLPQQNRRVSKEPALDNRPILAAGKHVVVIGGGDTGSDCVGTSIRQGALSVTQLEVMPKPPEKENKLLTWPDWPLKLRSSSSHQEGAERDFSVVTKSFSGENGEVRKLHCVRLDAGMREIEGSA
ncbi:MAG: glutamate synthase subunit beta, partial [Burkholderiales bacterium]